MNQNERRLFSRGAFQGSWTGLASGTASAVAGLSVHYLTESFYWALVTVFTVLVVFVCFVACYFRGRLRTIDERSADDLEHLDEGFRLAREHLSTAHALGRAVIDVVNDEQIQLAVFERARELRDELPRRMEEELH